MATPKKATTKKVIIKKEATDDELILGKAVKDEVKTVVKYEEPSIEYRVHNLKSGNVDVFDGSMVEVFIGSKNVKARKELIDGAKEVITYDAQGKEAYKIEVI